MANTLQIVVKAKDEASRALAGVEKALDGIGKKGVSLGSVLKGVGTAAGIGLAAIGTAAAAAGGALAKLALDAMPVEGIAQAFDGITDSADEMLAALRKGSLGMVADIDLMKSYNLAAQLVGKQFADQLPDAMGYLGKVAAATGTSMDYMMDSLVRGVGRLSPLILDNLGISIKLEDAYAEYAATLGKSVDDLTKAEQQAAVMNKTMQLLAENTASMPDLTGSAVQGWGALRTQFQNTKLEIGRLLLPALQDVMAAIQPLVDRWLPGLVGWFEARAVPAIRQLVDAFRMLTEGDLPGAIGRIWETLTGGDPTQIVQFVTNAVDWLGQLSNWVRENGPKIGASITQGFEAAKTGLKLTLDGILKETDAFVTDGLQRGDELVRESATWLAEMEPLLQAAMLTILSRTSLVMGWIEARWIGFWPRLKELLLAGWEGIWGALDWAFGYLRGIAKAILQLIVGDWEGAWQTFLETQEEYTPQLLGGLIGMNEEMGMIMKGEVPNWHEFGRALLNGLIAGIQSRVASAIATVVAATRRIYEAGMAAIGARSPSRLFASMGASMMQGMAQGIVATTQLPVMAVQTAGIRAAQAVGSVTNHNNYNLTVHTSARSESIVGDFAMLRAMTA